MYTSHVMVVMYMDAFNAIERHFKMVWKQKENHIIADGWWWNVKDLHWKSRITMKYHEELLKLCIFASQ